MLVAVLLIVIGVLALVAAAQWRTGRWMASGRWIAGNVAPHAVVATPMLALFLIALGSSFLWPPLVVVALVAGVAFLAVLFGWSQRAPIRRLRLSLPEGEGEPLEARPSHRAGGRPSPSR
jgi:hypothetical protein